MNDESMVKSICMDADDIERAVTRMAHQILEANKGADNIALVGIVTRGDLLAKMLVHKIEEIEGVKVPLGKLDISFYRDDFMRNVAPVLHGTNIPFNILLFSIGVSRLRAGQGQGRVTIREVFSPGLIATLVAVVVFLFQIPVPSLLGDTIKSLANGTVPLSMIIIGVSLSHVPILDAFKDWKAYLVSLGRLVLCPILTYFVLGLFLEGTTLGVMVAIAACPSAAMITILSLRYGIDDTFASRVNFLSTILCAVTLPIMTYFLL